MSQEPQWGISPKEIALYKQLAILNEKLSMLLVKPNIESKDVRDFLPKIIYFLEDLPADYAVKIRISQEVYDRMKEVNFDGLVIEKNLQGSDLYFVKANPIARSIQSQSKTYESLPELAFVEEDGSLDPSKGIGFHLMKNKSRSSFHEFIPFKNWVEFDICPRKAVFRI